MPRNLIHISMQIYPPSRFADVLQRLWGKRISTQGSVLGWTQSLTGHPPGRGCEGRVGVGLSAAPNFCKNAPSQKIKENQKRIKRIKEKSNTTRLIKTRRDTRRDDDAMHRRDGVTALIASKKL